MTAQLDQRTGQASQWHELAQQLRVDSIRSRDESAQTPMWRDRDSFPHVGGTQPLHDPVSTTDVIRISMREHQRMQPPSNTERPQRRHDDTAADVERRAGDAAGIDQQRRAIRQDHDRRVTLADIEHHDAQRSR